MEEISYQVLEHQHIFEEKRWFLQCHASTICRLPDGTLGVAWFEVMRKHQMWQFGFQKREKTVGLIQ